MPESLAQPLLKSGQGYLRRLQCIRKGDVLIVAKRDRLSRSLPIAIAIEELLKGRKATLISANGEGTGESTENVSSVMESRMSPVFSEIERQMIRDRTRAALAVKKSRGERVGTVPYGYQLSNDGIHLEKNPTEQKVIAVIGALRGQGKTFNSIVGKLNHDNALTRKGTLWQYRSVWNIVRKSIQLREFSLLPLTTPSEKD